MLTGCSDSVLKVYNGKRRQITDYLYYNGTDLISDMDEYTICMRLTIPVKEGSEKETLVSYAHGGKLYVRW